MSSSVFGSSSLWRAEVASATDQWREQLDRSLVALGDHRPEGGRLDDGGAGKERIGEDRLEEGAKRDRHLPGPGRGRLGAERSFDLLGEARHLGVEELEEAVLLAGEVLVESFEADAGALDDALDGDVVIAADGDKLAGGPQDALALGVGGPPSGHRRRLDKRGPRISAGQSAHVGRIAANR